MSVVESLVLGDAVRSAFGHEGGAAMSPVEFLVLGDIVRSAVGAKGVLR